MACDQTLRLQLRMDALIDRLISARERLSGETTRVPPGDLAFSFAIAAMRALKT